MFSQEGLVNAKLASEIEHVNEPKLANISLERKNLFGGEHASLFCSTVGEEEKKFHNIDAFKTLTEDSILFYA